MPARCEPIIVGVDQGTSSTKAIAVSVDGRVMGRVRVPLRVHHPAPGWVEQDPNDIRDSVVECLKSLGLLPGTRIAAIGISSQRESALVWDSRTGRALSPLIGWQDRRTAERASLLGDSAASVRQITGLPLDPMFSALKFGWILDEIDPGRQRARQGRLTLGTVDSWLLRCLCGEDRIELGNAARTQLLDLRSLDWSQPLLELFDIPRQALPRIVHSDEASGALTVEALAGLPPISGVLGDSHAALFAHGVRDVGGVKVTYGTGSSVMGLAGAADVGETGMVRTIAWSRGEPTYAFEGNILSTGATIEWLARALGVDAAEIDRLAWTVAGSEGLSFVPAFDGLGAPWWEPNAKAAMVGMNLGTSLGHIARAVIESVPLQVEDVLAAADKAAGARIPTLFADGGPSRNGRLMQLQADISGRSVARSAVGELSALGAAHLAGLSVGLVDEDVAERQFAAHESFEPSGEGFDTTAWKQAVDIVRSRGRESHQLNTVGGAEERNSVNR